ncbi:serine/threonine-protein kinase pink-1, mitochondrial-like [Patiria miniata]|uniref:non-specific serine/threonine protein kinase n=1 Tax=Patiria miniata TaxID=46514 RepID=A0A914BL99_PATMI|nr:serine/threonine-protein kinase pink-1, mitochondrial-like [Patiria miniata]
MSFRAAFVRLKQLAAEVLARKRVLLITGKAHKQEGLLQAAPRPLPRKDPATPVNHLQRVFVGYQSNSASWAAQLRRNAALRLIQSRSLVGRGVGGRGRLPIYAFLGLTLAAGERSVLEGNDGAMNENEKMRGRLPLETWCEIVRGVFQNQRPNDELQCPADEEPFPSDTASYDISDRLLGKGTSASIYAARLTPLPSTEGAVDNAMGAEEDVGGDDGLSFQEDDSEDWEMVSNETEERLEEDAAGSMELSSWESLDDVADADDDVVVEEKEESKDGHPVKDEAGGGYDLALKMMFNYDIASNAIAISRTFEREYLPLWPSLESGSFGDFRWENGHRAKKKDHRFLPPHANIAVIHHVFVAPTVAHDLEEARTLFPAALPARLHIDGMGRNQTMYLVMKRYDMTLAEYNRSIGCPTQQVAMTIIAQLLEGVAYLVRHGIAHRDLKSNNILVELTEGSPHVVIADFGCCLADDAVGLQLPYPLRHMEIGGNSALMAPEVKLAIPGPAAKINYTKSDAWAVGAISFEVLGLPNPFYRHGDNHPGLDSARYEDADLPAIPDNVHQGLGKIIRLLLKKDPSERPSATVAANMLHLLLWQQPVFTVASWEGSKLVPAISLQKQQMATWLLNLSARVLSQRSPGGQTASKSQKSWLDDTQYQLCLTFLSRVTSSDLMTAARRLVP